MREIFNRFVAVMMLALGGTMPAFAVDIAQLELQRYDIGVIPLPTTGVDQVVNLSNSSDLIFQVTLTGQKFLVIPADNQARGDFDPSKQFFYMIDRSNDQIRAFSTIDSVLIRLDGTYFSDETQSPPQGESPREIISRPPFPDFPETKVVDICIFDDDFIGYRTDGPDLDDEFVYTITREPSSRIVETIPVSLKNASPGNGNLNAFIEYDPELDRYLLFQTSLDTTNNLIARDRISALQRSDAGAITSQFFLESAPDPAQPLPQPNTQLPLYTLSGATGITIDRETGIIYLLDPPGRQIFTFTPRRPTINSITPSSGPSTGGTEVTISGIEFPDDVAVTFDGIPGQLTSASLTRIKVLTPPHVPGAVDVQLTGSSITAARPVIAENGFTYLNTVPIANLTASPKQGDPPLLVSFDTSLSSDADGAIVTRRIDFGDGSAETLAAGAVATTHSYFALGTFFATLAVTDSAGAQATASVVIIVGSGEGNAGPLVLRQFAMKVVVPDQNRLPGPPADSVSLKGEIVLPGTPDILGIDDFQNGGLRIAIGNASVDHELNEKAQVKTKTDRFSLKLIKKLGAEPNRYSFTYSTKKRSLQEDLQKDLPGSPGLDLTTPARVPLNLFVRLETGTGDVYIFGKSGQSAALVTIKPGRTSAVTFTRK